MKNNFRFSDKYFVNFLLPLFFIVLAFSFNANAQTTDQQQKLQNQNNWNAQHGQTPASDVQVVPVTNSNEVSDLPLITAPLLDASDITVTEAKTYDTDPSLKNVVPVLNSYGSTTDAGITGSFPMPDAKKYADVQSYVIDMKTWMANIHSNLAPYQLPSIVVDVLSKGDFTSAYAYFLKHSK